jgi:hypothetical protein
MTDTVLRGMGRIRTLQCRDLGNRFFGIFRSDVGDVHDLPGVSDTVEDTG